MRKLVVSEWMSLDGVFDAETMEQWYAPYDSKARQDYTRASILGSDALVFGRTTYEMLAPHWSAMTHNEDGVADWLNSVPKYVVSSSLKKADWNNTTIIKDNVIKELNKLKQQSGREIQIEGSAALVESLQKGDVIDEYRFLMHPIIAGKGKRFFNDGMSSKLKLIDTKALDLGVNLVCYEAA
jgi:dihydrofolate reductase